MSPAEQITRVLERPAFAFAGGPNNWVLTISRMGGKDNTITVYDQPGRGSEVGVAIDYPAIQLIARGSAAGGSYAALYAKMVEARDILHAIPEHPAEYPELVSCVVRGGIAPLGNDDNDRPRLSLNFNLITSPAAVGNREQY